MKKHTPGPWKFAEDDFTRFAVSDAGPKHQVHVYQQLTGNIIWAQPWWMPYRLAILRADKILKLKAEGKI